MSLQMVANIATIVGTISIFITLVFVIIELHKNLNQFRLIREINLREVQSSFYNHWSEPHNAELVIKGGKSYDALTEEEKFSFENYFEVRLRIIAFTLNVETSQEGKDYLYSRLSYWFSQPGYLIVMMRFLESTMFPKDLLN